MNENNFSGKITPDDPRLTAFALGELAQGREVAFQASRIAHVAQVDRDLGEGHLADKQPYPYGIQHGFNDGNQDRLNGPHMRDGLAIQNR